jgi:hypothetical protein
MKLEKIKSVSRRDFLKVGGVGVASLAGLASLRGLSTAGTEAAHQSEHDHAEDHGAMGTVGQVDHEANGFTPMDLLYDFDYGEVKEENGRTVREWQVVAVDREFEIAPGI